MKNKKQFFGTLFSVLISVFLVFLGVYATTTVGNDVTVGDDLIVTEDVVLTGNDIGFANGASISNAADAELLTLTETLVSIVGKASVSSNLNVDGNTTLVRASISDDFEANYGQITSASLGTTIITGNLTGLRASLSDSLTATDIVRGGSLTDGTATLTGGAFAGLVHASVSDDLTLGGQISLFGGTASPGGGATTNCTQGDWYFRSGQAASASLYFCETADEWDQIIGIDLGN